MRLLDKINEKGIIGCIKSVKYRLVKIYNFCCFNIYIKLPIDEYSIVLESEGDCCDNAYALFDYMKKNGYLKKYKITWLVDYPENYQDDENVKYVYKNIFEHFSKETIKALRTCHYYIYDHCNMLLDYKKRNGQKISYLCHGYAGFKAPKGIGKFNADEEFTTGKIPLKGCIDWHGTTAKKYILGFSRLDYFYNTTDECTKLAQNLIEEKKFFKVFLWMPTFRQSDSKELSEDYLKGETGLPLLESMEAISAMNEFLRKINVKIVLKIHHLQSKLEIFNESFSHIQFLRDEDIAKCGLQLYQLIPVFDSLITDYSSISTDYFLLDKPIIYILDDIEEYEKSRGIYPANALDYMPGEHVYNICEFQMAIERVVKGEDKFKKIRHELIPKFHTYQDGNSSKRILEHLGIRI